MPATSFIPSGVVHGFEVEPAATDAIVVSIADGALLPIRAQTILPLEMPVMVADMPANPRWKRLEATMIGTSMEFRVSRNALVRNRNSIT